MFHSEQGQHFAAAVELRQGYVDGALAETQSHAMPLGSHGFVGTAAQQQSCGIGLCQSLRYGAAYGLAVGKQFEI